MNIEVDKIVTQFMHECKKGRWIHVWMPGVKVNKFVIEFMHEYRGG